MEYVFVAVIRSVFAPQALNTDPIHGTVPCRQILPPNNVLKTIVLHLYDSHVECGVLIGIDHETIVIKLVGVMSMDLEEAGTLMRWYVQPLYVPGRKWCTVARMIRLWDSITVQVNVKFRR